MENWQNCISGQIIKYGVYRPNFYKNEEEGPYFYFSDFWKKKFEIHSRMTIKYFLS